MGSYFISGRSAASQQEVFDLIADAPGWSRWAGPIIVRSWWEREGDPAPGGVGAIRRFGLGRVSSREEIISFDPPRSMSYRVLAGLPVRDYLATVSVIPIESGGSEIEWSAVFTPLVPGTATVVTFFLNRMVGGFVRRAAVAAVKGSARA